ncbi:trypsin-like serine protease [Halobacillus yeomjeoni]|uniref:Trypsin-like serine protease n=1 Tax=Halobacillus yeomjeoni TaxID=311194 RepID=A0A931HS42_9BACI|nr:trypsin-like serine protease [Halobacillus yeomjeoni]MBH0228830.1 trypsin-like serine protease [Halobacillus yeomjeoni]
MKKIILLTSLLLLSFGIFNGSVLAHDDSREKSTNAKQSEKVASKQNKNKEKIERKLSKIGVSFEEVFDMGDFYYKNEKIVVNILKDAGKLKGENKKEKYKKVKHKLTKLHKKNKDSVLFNEVSFSREELNQNLGSFYDVNSSVGFSENTIIWLDSENNRLELKTNKLSDKNKKRLNKDYGKMLKINIDPSFTTNFKKTNHVTTVGSNAYKGREADWNKLGAGLGIKWQTNGERNSCSTAGTVTKDTREFLVTAGHCIEDVDNDIVYQWDSVVGAVHLDAQASGFDLGLIQINNNGIERKVSNGLFLYGDSDGYDAGLTGTDTPLQDERHCKTGKTTGVTCGDVTKPRLEDQATGQIQIEVTREETNAPQPYLLAKGDSGGALYDPDNNELVGITSMGILDYSFHGEANQAGYVGYFTPFEEVANKYDLTLYTNPTARGL